jgi:putative DNA primase/helicase
VTAKLLTRFIILTNELPRLTDTSGALAGRMILLRLTESWLGREDTELTDKLLTELPGILLWAIAGWKRLKQRGHFLQPESAREMMCELEDLASPVGCFVREKCFVKPGAQIERDLLFKYWLEWCEAQGRDHPGDIAAFGRNLRAAVPSIGSSQPRAEDGKRYRAYEGICTK